MWDKFMRRNARVFFNISLFFLMVYCFGGMKGLGVAALIVLIVQLI